MKLPLIAPEADDMVDPEALDEPAPPEAPEVDAEVPLVPDIEDPEAVVEPEPIVAPEVAPGCIADEPEVADPEPLAAGRSVPPEGAV